MSKRIRAWLGAAALLMLPPESSAQDCNAILAHGLRNIEITASSGASTATSYYNHCHKNFQSMDDQQLAQLEVEVFGYGQGGGSLSTRQRAQSLVDWCQTNRQTATEHRQDYQESRTFYAAAVEAWSTCNMLVAEKLSIRPYITPDSSQVDLALRYTGSAAGGVRLTGIVARGFQCTIVTPDGTTLKPGDTLSNIAIGPQTTNVHCERDASSERQLNEEPYMVDPEGTIVIQSGGDPVQLYFPEQWTPAAPIAETRRLQERIEQVERDLAEARTQLTSRISQARTQLNRSLTRSLTQTINQGDTSLSQRLASVRVRTVQFYFGESDRYPIFGPRFACNRWSNISGAAEKEAARLCGAPSKVETQLLFRHSGDNCGYNGFLATCLWN